MKPVTDVCLGCICEAVSGCNRTLTCNGDVCGLFRITWAYWADSGKPTLAGEAPSTDTGKYILLSVHHLQSFQIQNIYNVYTNVTMWSRSL